MSQIVVISLIQRKMQNAWHKYLLFNERRKGIDILQFVTTEELHLDSARSLSYTSSGNRFLKRVAKKLPITSDDAILDFGCGKGGALVTLSKFPFRKLGGVELSSELYAIAKKNMAQLHITYAELTCCDAGEFTALDDYTYLYFANPFPAVVMEEVMKNLIHNLQSRPRKLTIIYFNPTCHDTIINTGVFTKTAEFPADPRHSFFIYQYTQA